MPAKNNKKSTDKSPKLNRKVKKEIKEMADAIPKLIANDIKKSQDTAIKEFAAENPKKISRPSARQEMKRKKRLLWTGVIIFSSVVMLMWVWNASSLIYDIKNNDSPEEKLWESAKTDFSEILSSLNDPGEDDLSKSVQKNTGTNNINEAFNVLLANIILPATTSTASSTEVKADLPLGDGPKGQKPLTDTPNE